MTTCYNLRLICNCMLTLLYNVKIFIDLCSYFMLISWPDFQYFHCFSLHLLLLVWTKTLVSNVTVCPSKNYLLNFAKYTHWLFFLRTEACGESSRAGHLLSKMYFGSVSEIVKYRLIFYNAYFIQLSDSFILV